MTFLPFPFAVMNTHKAFRFCNSVCRGPVCHCHSPAIPLLTHMRHSASATHFAEQAAWYVPHCHSPAIQLLTHLRHWHVPHCYSPAIQLLTHIRHSTSSTHFVEEAVWPVCHCHSPAIQLLTHIRHSASATLCPGPARLPRHWLHGPFSSRSL